MPSEGTICQVCGTPVAWGASVYCRACGTPHHRDCWEYLGRCSTFGCEGKRASDQPPEPPAPLVIDERTAEATATLPRGAVAPVVRVDLDTPLEVGTLGAAVGLALAGGVLLFTSAPPLWGLSALGLSGLAWLTHAHLDCTYVLDHRSRSVDYLRSVFGLQQRWRVCRFDEVAGVAVRGSRQRGESGPAWTYGVVLATREGLEIRLSNEYGLLEDANGAAFILSRYMGVAFHENPGERDLVVAPGSVRYGPWAPTLSSTCAAFGSVVLTAAFVAAVALLSLLR